MPSFLGLSPEKCQSDTAAARAERPRQGADPTRPTTHANCCEGRIFAATVAGGVLDLEFKPSVGQAIVSSIEVVKK
jgi:hypothetical protein